MNVESKDSSTPHLDLLRCRCLLRDDADEVFRDWLARDMRAAQLTRTFRAYYRLRSLLPLPIRHMLQRFRRVRPSERWYFPDAFINEMARFIGARDGGVTTIHPWPDGATYSFVLTHDVETAEGMRRVAQIADIEEELGFRSSWNFVPYKYKVDQGVLHDLTNRGFEIGIHGYNHDGRLFASRAIFEGRVPAINAAIEKFGAVGFRAPMVHRNLNWLQALDIEYDASCFDTDCYQAMPGGVGATWPFIAGRFVELPYTLPQDHTLFIVLGERDGRAWELKRDFIERLGGMALMITHPDYLDSRQRIDIYRRFLLTSRDRVGMWHALPRDTAAWWRARDASNLNIDIDGRWRIHGPAAERGRVASIRLLDHGNAVSPASLPERHLTSPDPPSTLSWRDVGPVSRCPSWKGEKSSRLDSVPPMTVNRVASMN